MHWLLPPKLSFDQVNHSLTVKESNHNTVHWLVALPKQAVHEMHQCWRAASAVHLALLPCRHHCLQPTGTPHICPLQYNELDTECTHMRLPYVLSCFPGHRLGMHLRTSPAHAVC